MPVRRPGKGRGNSERGGAPCGVTQLAGLDNSAQEKERDSNKIKN